MQSKELAGIFFEFDSKQHAIEQAQSLAEIKNQMRRHQDRMRSITVWSKPDAIAERIKKHEEEAAKALERALELKAKMGMIDDDIPIPDPLPKHLRGQALSTIKAMLRHERR